ncbi:MAG: TAXI family TRAP transporter solute-binding subunit [Candidatus Lambdaproteobacteria bacterium]|nr:TAXI family TRAP transporter solute-binding subunit [Candidatus Lambdaproteobacteria bacterium]
MKHLVAAGLALALALGLAQSGQAAQFITIGTGGVTGVYYPTGGAICRLVNKGRAQHGIRCSAESTGGSVHNVQNVIARELDFGIAQSDVHWKAWNGTEPFAARQATLRSVFSIHPETAILVVRADAGIRQLTDIRGKRINMGNPGSGTLPTAQDVLSAIDLTPDDLALAGGLKSAEQGDALRDNKHDGFFFLVGHPNGGIKDIFFSVDARLIPLVGPGIDNLVARYPYYVHAKTPGGLYRGVDRDVATIAVKATLVTSSEVDEAVVYALVKAVFSDLEEFKALHPAFRDLTAKDMLQGLTAPLHKGAVRYFREAGLM